MRITCPNCDAIYEIDADLIPPEGRDVQCSSCGHVWSQSREAADAAPAPAAAPAEGGGAEPAIAPEPEPAHDRAPEGSAPDEDGPGDGEGEGDDDGPDGAADAPRRRPDDDTLRILREEAARETARRRAERDGAGTGAKEAAAPPPDAGAPDPAPRQTRAAPVPSRPDRDEAPRPGAADRITAPAHPGREAGRAEPARSRRSDASGDLLPDLDEINSTLSAPRRHGSHPSDPAASPAPRARSSGGFLSGFVAVFGIAVVVAGLYLAAPWLVDRVPSLESPLAAYVGAVNAVREWVGARLEGLSAAVAALGG